MFYFTSQWVSCIFGGDAQSRMSMSKVSKASYNSMLLHIQKPTSSQMQKKLTFSSFSLNCNKDDIFVLHMLAHALYLLYLLIDKDVKWEVRYTLLHPQTTSKGSILLYIIHLNTFVINIYSRLFFYC